MIDPFTASAGGLALAIKLWLLHHGVSIGVAIDFISDCVDDDTARQIKRTFNRIKNQL